MSRKLPETISEEELIDIVNHTEDPRYQLAFTSAFYQSLRVSEVVNLKKEDINVSKREIYIRQSKGGKDRTIPIIKPLKIKPNSYLYRLNRFPIGVGARALQLKFRQKASDVLNRDLRFHTLRHSGATWLLNKKKWDIRKIQRFLGHSKLQTTEIYTHVSPQDLIELEWGEEDTY